MSTTRAPLRRAARLAALATVCATTAGTAVAPAFAFNPQPDPPGRAIHVDSVAAPSLNPQPLPPIVFRPVLPPRIP
jgi:hypothetical protein